MSTLNSAGSHRGPAYPLRTLGVAGAALLLLALSSVARAEVVLDNLGSPNFNNATVGDRIGAAIQIGSTPITISTIEFHQFFTGGYVFRPGQTFAIYSRNANGTVGTPLFTDFTLTPGSQSTPRTTVTANSAFTLQANTSYWLLLSKAPGGNFVLWNFNPSETYTSGFGRDDSRAARQLL
jgi:hypothetical protein